MHKADRLSAAVEREISNAAAARGVDVDFLQELSSHGFSQDELFDLVVPRRTLARRRQSGQRLSLEESDRAVRLGRITAMAERVFADQVKAQRWMRKPSPMLQGASPIEMLKTETGAQLVEQALHRIDYGMFA